MGNNVTLSDGDLENLQNDFFGIFHLSYLDFCKANLIDQPKDDMIDKWVCQTVDSYQRRPKENTYETGGQSEMIGPPSEIVMSFFNIPTERRTTILQGHYKVTADGVHLNTDKRVLDIKLKCHIQPTSIFG